MKCEFCTSPENQKRKIAENDLSWSFLTYIPIVPGHSIIVPKRCVSKADDLKEEEILAMFALRAKLKVALTKTFEAEGFNYAWNEGEIAGQDVPHIHIHMLPRKEGDTGITKYEPREFLYRPGGREKTPEKELQEVAKTIKEAL